MRLLETLALCSLVVAGCSAKPATPSPTFSGRLTAAIVEAGAKEVRPFQPWKEAYASLLAGMGSPVLVDGQKHWWAVLDREACVATMVERRQDEVGTVMRGARFDAAMASAGGPAGACFRAARGR